MAALAVLAAMSIAFAQRYVNFGIPPFEDAAMLMRYSKHLAQGQGIVWNVGDPPVDGATDFLFMLVVAGVHRLGLSMESAVRSITILSHFCTVALVYLGVRIVQGSSTMPAFLSAAYFAVGPGLFLSAAYFGTPFFAFFIASSWLLAQRLMFADSGSTSGYAAFALSCLVAGLIRPEGVLIGASICAALFVTTPTRPGKLALVFGGVFLTLGGSYFIWRWNYFGYPLPNPYYKKGGGGLHWTALRNSVVTTLQFSYPFVPAFLLSLRSASAMRRGIAFALPIAVSTGMWVMLSGEMNFFGRFQYPTMVLATLAWYPLISTVRRDYGLPSLVSLSRLQRLALGLSFAFVLAVIFARQVWHSKAATYHRDGRYDVAVMLREYAGRGYTMATTEAGLLPYYSEWRAVDTWGLNDKWIAHHGMITDDYLKSHSPALIMLHAGFGPLDPPPPDSSEPWMHQVLTLRRYAERHNYVLAAAFGISPADTHYYYVLPSLPDADDIVRGIRATEYMWVGGGGKAVNYAIISPTSKQPAPSISQ
jgi:hypothetical protein